jgi:NADPH:quinone reductase-like Zn-dependent oxidoreductase
MRAVTRRQYGETEVLRVEEVERPELTEGRVLVRVKAAGVNMAEWHLMTGMPTIARLAFGLRRPKDPLLGQDVAGVVEHVGPGVTSVAVGDEVFGSGVGTWAEFARVRADLLHAKPANVSFEEAAAVPMAGYTALQALRVVGPLERKHIAVTGAGGGVGSFAVQLAAARGARVTAVCSARKAEFVRRLGAHDVIDYATTDPTAGERRFDAVIDFAGGLPLARWRRVIKPGGILVLGGAENGGDVLGPLSRSIGGVFTRGLKVVTLMAATKGDDLAELATLLASGELRSPVARTYPLDGAAQAIDDLRAATHPGKLVLVP